MEKVIFVGAGPGAPDLLTIRGKEIIENADVVIYAGSLVNPEILSCCKKDAAVYNSATMTLNEIIKVMATSAGEGKKVARVHTGDPSIYGAEQEQMRELDRLGIPYEVVPGVSSFLAAAASLKREYTLPGVSQSVILTRMEGRTAVPDSESIESLAAHRSSMAIFLSVADIDVLCERLIKGGYPYDTPAAVVYKASWDDEKQVRGTLGDIAGKVRKAGINRTALILVGRFLEDDFENSKLYDETFSHGYRRARTFHAKRIMIQGTMSSAGKSFVTAALLRIFKQDGFSAAPFKSQNMALNSSVTKEGLEIGRAQAMQAEAAGIDATVLMNPILLKPTGDEESQVVVLGEVRGNMSAAEYYERKAGLIPVIEDSFSKLSDEYDIVVIEGAGSPAEINLKENDIVNMGMAAMADAPVILVADIDRGGVFAQIVGTVELMDPGERDRIKGIIINKFRGDVDLLRPGIEEIEERTGIPVLGVIPMTKLDLDEEDSLAPRLENGSSSQKESDVKEKLHPAAEEMEELNIVVIRLPHISNFTDFSVLERWEGVSLSYVSDIKGLAGADVIIIPGTKNTMADLSWLRSTNLAEMITDLAENKKVMVIGICGGYQMLGDKLYDPEGVEGERESCALGLGLLPVTTRFTEKKTRALSRGVLTDEALKVFAPDRSKDTGLKVEGYEIHMGSTTLTDAGGNKDCFPFLVLSDGREDGYVRADGACFGTYIHGLFDNIPLTYAILKKAAEGKGITDIPMIDDVKDYKEREYDRLADTVRCSLDMEAVYRILDESAGRTTKNE